MPMKQSAVFMLLVAWDLLNLKVNHSQNSPVIEVYSRVGNYLMAKFLERTELHCSQAENSW